MITAKAGKNGWKIITNKTIKDLLYSLIVTLILIAMAGNWIPAEYVLFSPLIFSLLDIIMKMIQKYQPNEDFSWFWERVIEILKEIKTRRG